MIGFVLALAARAEHGFSKEPRESIRLVAGEGVEGDAHRGVTVRHRSRVARDPTRPNLRQVHLMHAELFDELRVRGFDVRPGQLGENVTMRGLDLLALSSGTRLLFEGGVELVVTGLRNPCGQIDAFRPGLLQAVLDRTADGVPVRKAGVMSIVATGGTIRPGELVQAAAPSGPLRPLEPV
ncbi:MAG: MOSC domain-containing protein [Alphaproteobacteria bacterium]|nr:MOSC domain-containing protein [Alphaproteobacteria bacterium]